MTLFRWDDNMLTPASGALDLMQRRMVREIPGAIVDDETGETQGANHLLHTVASVFGAVGKPPNRRPLKTNHRPQLSKYQLYGVARLEREMEAGAVCHDDVGLGKTPTTIAALAGLPLVKLVLCPSYLRPQWRSEIRKWTKVFRGIEEFVHLVKPPSEVRKKDPPLIPASGHWVVAYYAEAQRAIDAIHAHHAQGYVMVVDEAHNLRTLGSHRTQEVKDAAIWASGRIALTGDLLVNNYPKLYPILDIVQPGAFGSYTDFIRRYAGATHNDYAWVAGKHPTHEAELKERLGYFMFRRTWDDIPPAERPFETAMQTIWVPIGKGHRALRSLMAKGIETMTYAKAIAEAKGPAIIEALRNDQAAGIPSLTFTLTRKQASELAHAVKGFYVDGDTEGEKRLAKVAAYVRECELKGRTPMVFSTFQALGEGANLQWAKVVNMASIPFGSDVLRQAFARAARRGNVGTITARFFVARGTADEQLVALIRQKLKMQLALAGKNESAKVDMLGALEFSAKEVNDVLQRMLDEARAKEGIAA